MVLLRRRDAIKYLQGTGYLLSCSLTMVAHGVFLILLVLSSSYILIRAAPPKSFQSLVPIIYFIKKRSPSHQDHESVEDEARFTET